jgi:hypothetical protein
MSMISTRTPNRRLPIKLVLNGCYQEVDLASLREWLWVSLEGLEVTYYSDAERSIEDLIRQLVYAKHTLTTLTIPNEINRQGPWLQPQSPRLDVSDFRAIAHLRVPAAVWLLMQHVETNKRRTILYESMKTVVR